MSYSDEQIASTVREAREHIHTSGGKKTPGVENRRALVAIIEQLRAEKDQLEDELLAARNNLLNAEELIGELRAENERLKHNQEPHDAQDPR